MRPLTIFLCGTNPKTLKHIARTLVLKGVSVQTSTEVLDCLRISQDKIDFMLIELDGLYGHLLALLPTIRRTTPNLPLIGLFTSPKIDPLLTGMAYSLELDDYWFEIPQPEELIVRFPQVAHRYLYETKPSHAINTFDILEKQFKVVLKV
ncbi:MAG: hypothetical protein KDJ65_02200 [Anaerolineae bacterium]|nr:hypothetical protein [Anaerolineae bacterium]